jgi:hypothetical protein
LQTAAYLYPWDIVGDPAAADTVAGLGLSHVAVAAVYHATRALTPRHPAHRVVTAAHSAAYYAIDERAWAAAALRPVSPQWTQPGFGTATSALRASGVPVHAWVVFTHVDLPGPNPFPILNAYGDGYPWAVCPAQPAVQEYALGLAGDVARLPGIDGIELEACGWYGFDHLSAHDKTSGVGLSGAAQYLLSLCFCAACDAGYRAAGIEPGSLRTTVKSALEPVFAGADPPAAGGGETDQIRAALGDELAGAVSAMREGVAERLRRAVVARIREVAPRLAVVAHASPQPHGTTAFTGLDPAKAAGLLDGLVVQCWRDAAALTGCAGGPPVYASLLGIAGMGGHTGTLPEQARAAHAAGAAGLRIYHAGLAGSADLAAIRDLTHAIGEGKGS